MKKTMIILAAAALAGASTGVVAGDAAAGAAKTGTCVACHGKDGKAIAPNYPNLACQNEKYLVDALKQYKSGARNNPLMKPMVAMLNDADVENVAAYYASQPCK
jgi:cytochrome c553